MHGKNNAILAPLKTQSLRHSILEALTEVILSNKIKPGERVSERQLARELGVSRGPVREALLQLQEKGLVVNSPRRGMFVVKLTLEEMQDIYRVRIPLESEALRLAKEHLTPAGERRLKQWAEKVERLESTREIPADERARLDFELHRSLWSLAGNKYLAETLNHLTARQFMYFRIAVADRRNAPTLLENHRPLLDFMFGNGNRTAEEALLEHFHYRWKPEDFRVFE